MKHLKDEAYERQPGKQPERAHVHEQRIAYKLFAATSMQYIGSWSVSTVCMFTTDIDIEQLCREAESRKRQRPSFDPWLMDGEPHLLFL